MGAHTPEFHRKLHLKLHLPLNSSQPSGTCKQCSKKEKVVQHLMPCGDTMQSAWEL